jgi:hypothetical protein
MIACLLSQLPFEPISDIEHLLADTRTFVIDTVSASSAGKDRHLVALNFRTRQPGRCMDEAPDKSIIWMHVQFWFTI